MAASATFALKAGVWFRRARRCMVSPDSQATACPLSGRNSTYRPVQISGAGSVAHDERSPVRVKLKRMNCDQAKAYPPDGESKLWWDRLKGALGTSSSDFVNSSLFQLQAAARLPCSGISETAVNAALAMIEAASPKDE